MGSGIMTKGVGDGPGVSVGEGGTVGVGLRVGVGVGVGGETQVIGYFTQGAKEPAITPFSVATAIGAYKTSPFPALTQVNVPFTVKVGVEIEVSGGLSFRVPGCMISTSPNKFPLSCHAASE